MVKVVKEGWLQHKQCSVRTLEVLTENSTMKEGTVGEIWLCRSEL